MSADGGSQADADALAHHLVLDMDGTLIAAGTAEPYARPGLEIFLAIVFAWRACGALASVGLWTGASAAWVARVHDAALRPALDGAAARLGHASGALEWDYVAYARPAPGASLPRAKPLDELARSLTGRSLRMHVGTMWLVDDTPAVAVCNGSAWVPIASYARGPCDELARVAHELAARIGALLPRDSAPHAESV